MSFTGLFKDLFDLVVAADGSTSKTRSMVLDEHKTSMYPNEDMNPFSLNCLVGTPNDTYCSVTVPKPLYQFILHRRSQVLRRLHMIIRPSCPKVVGLLPPSRPKLTLCKRHIK